MTIPAQSAGSVIGRHGRTVRKLEEETGARISIDAAGAVKISAGSRDSAIVAQQRVQDIAAQRQCR
ncbi:hypothetical protein H9L22_14295 [Tessaracoccus defluvii]|uniref:K Homology domain-containing protein n=1 Tax=Tessaracoccus defluvii TaxID=1285901 RepID=A0A7H0H4A1_9ACTN|nr:hypothetical protein H9L22_14295 [Tessaracoccus defluvii]